MEKQTLTPPPVENLLSYQDLLKLASVRRHSSVQDQRLKVNKTLDVWIKAKKDRV